MVDEPKAAATTNGANMLLQFMQDAADDGKHDVVLDYFRALQARKGVQTTEFYVAVVVNAIGFGLQFWPGHEAIGGTLIAVASTAYMLSRGVAKKNGG